MSECVFLVENDWDWLVVPVSNSCMIKQPGDTVSYSVSVCMLFINSINLILNSL